MGRRRVTAPRPPRWTARPDGQPAPRRVDAVTLARAAPRRAVGLPGAGDPASPRGPLSDLCAQEPEAGLGGLALRTPRATVGLPGRQVPRGL